MNFPCVEAHFIVDLWATSSHHNEPLITTIIEPQYEPFLTTITINHHQPPLTTINH